MNFLSVGSGFRVIADDYNYQQLLDPFYVLIQTYISRSPSPQTPHSRCSVTENQSLRYSSCYPTQLLHKQKSWLRVFYYSSPLLSVFLSASLSLRFIRLSLAESFRHILLTGCKLQRRTRSEPHMRTSSQPQEVQLDAGGDLV